MFWDYLCDLIANNLLWLFENLKQEVIKNYIELRNPDHSMSQDVVLSRLILNLKAEYVRHFHLSFVGTINCYPSELYACDLYTGTYLFIPRPSPSHTFNFVLLTFLHTVGGVSIVIFLFYLIFSDWRYNYWYCRNNIP